MDNEFLEILIDPPAMGPHAPYGGRIRITRKNRDQRAKIIRLSRKDVELLEKIITEFWSIEEKQGRFKKYDEKILPH